MADLISRAAALDEIEVIMRIAAPNDYRWRIPDAIERLPAVDAAPVVHARWFDADGNPVAWSKALPSSPGGSCWCSVCGTWLVGSDELPVYGLYCPACGARMDGERRDEDAADAR